MGRCLKVPTTLRALFALGLISSAGIMGSTSLTAQTVIEPVAGASGPQQNVVADKPTVRNVAIFVLNRAGKPYDEKVAPLEDLIAARVTDLGFSVISRETSADSISRVLGKDTPLDAAMDKDSSVLALASNLGADYVFVATLTTLSRSEDATNAYGQSWIDVKDTLRVSYKILDHIAGGTLASDLVVVTKKSRKTKNSELGVDLNDLLDEASVMLAGSIQKKIDGGKIREVAGDSRQVDLIVNCTIQGLQVPDIIKNDKGEYVVSDTICKIGATNVTVLYNGIVIGTAPGSFKVSKGMGKIRLTRQGAKEWEQNISPRDKMAINVDLEMTDEALARWMKTTEFLQAIKSGEKMTDAEVEAIRGLAQTLRQSGFKVDVKADGVAAAGLMSLWANNQK